MSKRTPSPKEQEPPRPLFKMNPATRVKVFTPQTAGQARAQENPKHQGMYRERHPKVGGRPTRLPGVVEQLTEAIAATGVPPDVDEIFFSGLLEAAIEWMHEGDPEGAGTLLFELGRRIERLYAVGYEQMVREVIARNRRAGAQSAYANEVRQAMLAPRDEAIRAKSVLYWRRNPGASINQTSLHVVSIWAVIDSDLRADSDLILDCPSPRRIHAIIRDLKPITAP